MSMALNLQLPLPTGSLEAYVDAVQRIPLLSLEEEQELITFGAGFTYLTSEYANPAYSQPIKTKGYIGWLQIW